MTRRILALLLMVVISNCVFSYCPCRAGIDISHTDEITYGVELQLLVDSLSMRFDSFKADSSLDSINLDSLDIYYIAPWEISSDNPSYSDSMVQVFRDFVFNGGILFLFGEEFGIADGADNIIFDGTTGWFTGIEPLPEIVFDMRRDEMIFHTRELPIFSDVTDTVFSDFCGALSVQRPAAELANGGGTSYSLLEDSSFVGFRPPIYAMSRYGDGRIFYFPDFSSLRFSLTDTLEYHSSGNLDFITNVPCSNDFPNFVFEPGDSQFFRCFLDTLKAKLSIENFGIIDPESLYVSWNDVIYDTSSPLLEINDSILIFSIPLEMYDDNDTFNLCIHHIEDTSSVWYYDSICWTNIVSIDTIPPSFDFYYSRWYDTLYPGDTAKAIPPQFFNIFDPTGLDSSDIEICINESCYHLSDPGLLFSSDDILMFRFWDSGIYFPKGDTLLNICIHAQDLMTECTPNVLDTCYQLYVADREDCPCRGGISLKNEYYWSTPFMVNTRSLVDSLSIHYRHFSVDTFVYSFDTDSLDVYYIYPFKNGGPYPIYPDSVAQQIRQFVYDGGNLFLWGEAYDGARGSDKLIQNSVTGEWFTGIEPVNCMGSYLGQYRFVEHPVIPDSSFIDSVYAALGGTVYVNEPARVLANVRGTATVGDSVYIESPTTIAIAPYGRGLIFYHTDFSAMRYSQHPGGWEYSRGHSALTHMLPYCTNTPKFIHYPRQNSEIYCQIDTLSITTKIIQFGILDPESLFVMWNDSSYDTSSRYIDVYDSSFVFNIPPGTYHDNDTLFMCIHNIIDTAGYWYYDSICWAYTFNIDEEPPVFGILEPCIGETLSVVGRIAFTLTDTSYIDTMSLLLTFEDDYEFGIDHAALWKYYDVFWFDPSVAGFDFGEVDSFLDICVHAEDANQNCTPQSIDTCWQVYLNASAIHENNIPSQYELSVYPNPFNSICNIDGVPEEKAEIFDQQGHLINTFILPNKWNATDFEGNVVPSGTYFISVGNDKIAVKYVR